MSDSASEKWIAVRALYEQFGAPVQMLAHVTSAKVQTMDQRVLRDGWIAGQGLSVISRKLTRLIETRLDEINQDPSTTLNDDKWSRSLASLLKALESLVLAGTRIETMRGAIDKEGAHADDDLPAFDPAREAELDRELERLAQNLIEPQTAG